jgi:hypothetical protein
MALLVSDNGELQSLRYLVNSNRNIPRNLILKLYSSNTVPTETDVPSQSKYYEPYDSTGLVGYGTAPSTGYPPVVTNRHDEDYARQYGILLNGSEWNVRTILSPIASTTGSGNINEYTITVASVSNIAVGHYVTGGNVGSNAVVAAIDGNTIVLTVKNAATFSNQPLDFGVGTTTASYPEQTFTFTSAANNIYGYYLVRANNMPISLNGVEHAVTVGTGETIAKAQTSGTIGQSFVTLFPFSYTPTVAGVGSEFTLTVSSNVGINTRQRVIGVGIAEGARVVGIMNTTTIVLDKKNTGTVSGVATFYQEITEDICVGMGVTHGNLAGEVAAILDDTTVTGIDEKTGVVYLSSELQNNIQAATGNVVYFNYAEVSVGATTHGLVAGDVIYIAAGAANTTTTSGTYTIHTTENESTFTTNPALTGIGSATLYSSIFFAERFTNGPYNIQNNGDQIKVTLNVSLD